MSEPISRLSFEELSEGLSFEIRRTLRLQDIEAFCDLTGDRHPLHTDKAYAEAHGFDDVIAHGLLISSFSSTLIGMRLPGERAIVLSQSFRYHQPALPGEALVIKGTIGERDSRFKTIEVKVLISNDRDVAIARGEYLVKIRD